MHLHSQVPVGNNIMQHVYKSTFGSLTIYGFIHTYFHVLCVELFVCVWGGVFKMHRIIYPDGILTTNFLLLLLSLVLNIQELAFELRSESPSLLKPPPLLKPEIVPC